MSGPMAAPAAEAAPQSVIARICPLPEEATDRRLIPQARIVAPAAPWIRRPTMIPAPLVDSAISTHEAMKSSEPAEEDAPAAEHVSERPGGHDHRSADEHVAGHRPLQLRDGSAGVLAHRRQQDGDRRGVRVDDEGRHACGRQDPARGRAGPSSR